MKQVMMLLLVVVAGTSLAMEAAFVGPLGEKIGHFSATFSIFLIGSLLSTLALIVLKRNSFATLLKQPRWLFMGGVLGPAYVIVLTIATPLVGVGITIVGILSGQIFASLLIDHFGLLGSERRAIDIYRVSALMLILIALWLIY
ncbi:DMT family transporter [Psychrobacter frigidicola]|uniref:DMT family transporter n=1 Tax=Psychrobacter frigidicola TaxID=45611 RepID=A0A5C7A3N5_9GAMM|nr:DMT family transporter [Psychrobacter frigidicola]TXD98029.1 DMT family transporter [Psychrobacter frigidicola]